MAELFLLIEMGKTMKQILQQMNAALHAKSLKEFLEQFDSSLLDALLAAPAMLFAMLPAVTACALLIIQPESAAAYMSVSFQLMKYIAPIGTVIGSIGLIIYVMKHGFHVRAASALFILLGIWILISSAYNGFDAYSLRGEYTGNYYTYMNESMFSYFYYIFLFICCSCVSAEKRRMAVIHTIIAVTSVLSFISIIGFYTEDLGIFEIISQTNSAYNNSNHFAYVLTVTILLCAVLFLKEENSRRIAGYAISFMLNMTMLVLNDTLGAFLAVIIGLICIGAFSVSKENRYRLGIAVSVLFLLFIGLEFVGGHVISNITGLIRDVITLFTAPAEDIPQNIGSSRVFLLKTVFGYMKQRPISWIFGFGIEGYGNQLLIDNYEFENRVHNEFVEYLSVFGLPALISYIGGCVTVFWHGIKHRRALSAGVAAALAAAFGYLVSSFFGVTVFYTVPYVFILLGFGYKSLTESMPNLTDGREHKTID